jgi:hypothetical protein
MKMGEATGKCMMLFSCSRSDGGTNNEQREGEKKMQRERGLTPYVSCKWMQSLSLKLKLPFQSIPLIPRLFTSGQSQSF